MPARDAVFQGGLLVPHRIDPAVGLLPDSPVLCSPRDLAASAAGKDGNSFDGAFTRGLGLPGTGKDDREVDTAEAATGK